MRLTVLVENTASDEALQCVHGLSFYLEAAGKRILFDMGPGAQFAQNAQTLGVALDRVDFAVLSHGHYDHGGGLDVFLRRNDHAPVYLRTGAFAPHTDGAGNDIGLRPALEKNPRLIFTDALCEIAPGVRLFSQVTGRKFWSPINDELLEDGVQDAFSHEQNLLLEEDGKLVLIAGCAHCGMVNILERAAELAGRMPDVVVGGMHLAVGRAAPDDFILALAQQLRTYPCRFYTCHCTGAHPFALLRQVLGEQITALSGGNTLLI